MTASGFVALDSPLEVPSLVLLEAPAPFRMERIPLVRGLDFAPRMGARGCMNLGSEDAHILLPGLERFMMMEDHEDHWMIVADGVFSPGAERSKPLPPYATFSTGSYVFMFLPPTPSGLGIPPDYASLTLARESPCTLPRLLVRAGHKLVLGRTFPLHFPVVSIGGSLDSDVPLFRMPAATVARLTRGVGDLSYFVEPLVPSVSVSVSGSREAQRILTPLAILQVNDWELVLLPPSPARARAAR